MRILAPRKRIEVTLSLVAIVLAAMSSSFGWITLPEWAWFAIAVANFLALLCASLRGSDPRATKLLFKLHTEASGVTRVYVWGHTGFVRPHVNSVTDPEGYTIMPRQDDRITVCGHAWAGTRHAPCRTFDLVFQHPSRDAAKEEIKRFLAEVETARNEYEAEQEARRVVLKTVVDLT